MKNHLSKFLFVLAVSTAFLFTSCDDETEDLVNGPTVDFTTTPASSDGNVTVSNSDVLTINVSATAPLGFNVIRVTNAALNLGFERNRIDLGLETGATEADVQLSVTIETPGEYALEISVVDDEDNVASSTLNVTVEDARTSIYTAKLLYAPTGNEESKTFFSTNLGTTHTKNEVDASAAPSSIDIDFGFAAGASGALYLASPSSYPTFTGYDLSIWNDLNTTTFKNVTITNEEYLAATSNAKVQAIYDNGTNPQSTKSGFAVNVIYAFKLDDAKDGKAGLVKVTDLVDGNEDGDYIDSVDYIEIEVTVQN